MKYQHLFLFVGILLLGILGANFTSRKLDRMNQIRGFKPGATSETHKITDMYSDRSGAYWVTWQEQNVREPGNHRLNLPEELWDEYQIGDEIEITFVAGDKAPHHPDGIYASDGNFAFDRGLLLVEFGMIAVGLIGVTVVVWLLLRSSPSAKEQDVLETHVANPNRDCAS